MESDFFVEGRSVDPEAPVSAAQGELQVFPEISCASRSGDIVHDSKGRARPETLGADVRLSFFKLPQRGCGICKSMVGKGIQVNICFDS